VKADDLSFQLLVPPIPLAQKIQTSNSRALLLQITNFGISGASTAIEVLLLPVLKTAVALVLGMPPQTVPSSQF
jgi:hypothetical protein